MTGYDIGINLRAWPWMDDFHHMTKCCILGKTKRWYVKNIICFHSFFISRNVRMGRVRESQRWLGLHTNTWATVRFICETSAFLRRSLWVKVFLVYIIFWTPTQLSWSQLTLTRCKWTFLLSTMLPPPFMQHFYGGNTGLLFI